MARRMSFITFWALVVCASAISPVLAANDPQQIPSESLDKLENVLSGVCDKLWERSDEFFHKGQYRRSISVLRLVAELDPADDQAYGVASWLMYSLDEKDEGLAFLKLGLERNPDRYNMYEELAAYYTDLKDYKKAAEYYERATSFSDCPKIIWHALAHSYEKTGDLEKALKVWEHSAELEPGDPVVNNNLEKVKKQLAEKNAEKQNPLGGDNSQK